MFPEKPDLAEAGPAEPDALTKMEGEFLIIPSVSLLRDRVVVVNAGRYEPHTDTDDREITLPSFVEMYLKDYSTICVLDIDGIERGRPQLGQVSTVSRTKNVWYDPGARNAGDMADAFMAGAGRVIVGTKTLNGFDDLLECHETSNDYVLGLDWAGRILSRDATISQADPLEFLDRMHGAGVRRVLFNQLGRVRSDARMDEHFVREMVRRSRRFYLGGSGFDLATGESIRRAGLGVRGVVVSVLDLIRGDIVPEEAGEVEGGGVVVDRI
jgi:uncharacterized protein related to proFAR isomerase